MLINNCVRFRFFCSWREVMKIQTLFGKYIDWVSNVRTARVAANIMKNVVDVAIFFRWKRSELLTVINGWALLEFPRRHYNEILSTPDCGGWNFIGRTVVPYNRVFDQDCCCCLHRTPPLTKANITHSKCVGEKMKKPNIYNFQSRMFEKNSAFHLWKPFDFFCCQTPLTSERQKTSEPEKSGSDFSKI